MQSALPESSKHTTGHRPKPWKPSDKTAGQDDSADQDYNVSNFTGSLSECVNSVYEHLKALRIYSLNNKSSIADGRASNFPHNFAEYISSSLDIDHRHYQYAVAKKQEHEKVLATLAEQKRETRASLEALESIKQELQDTYTASLIGQDHKAIKGTEERIRESVQQREVLETRLNAIGGTEQHHQFEKGLWSTVAHSIKRAIAIKHVNQRAKLTKEPEESASKFDHLRYVPSSSIWTGATWSVMHGN
ncbi:MAG: hypothetical protein JG718_17740, partial [Candidatus Thiothrix moscowensis]|nr:hypothetical protein [Candidatus Thiothrix moscowensis]